MVIIDRIVQILRRIIRNGAVFLLVHGKAFKKMVPNKFILNLLFLFAYFIYYKGRMTRTHTQYSLTSECKGISSSAESLLVDNNVFAY